MKLKEKLAKDELPFFFKETEKAAKMNTFAIPPELLSEFLGKQGFYPFFLVFQKAYLAGFEKAREMAVEEAKNYPTHDDEGPCEPYRFCNVCGGGPAVALFIEKLGEEEVK